MLVYVSVWLLLSGADGWAFGLIFALAATVLSLWLRMPFPRLRLLYLPVFLGFFLMEVLLGAWDVARRALHPGMPLDPAWVTHVLKCTDPGVRLALSAMVGLMPGTLASHMDDDTLHLHVLDQSQAWRLPVQKMEMHLARLFGVKHS
jgi:multicomponent Na+:H+ antiporter subunit E